MLKKFANKLKAIVTGIEVVVSNKKGEGFVDSGVKVLIAVVIGALLLGGLYIIIGSDVIPLVQTKIYEIFYYIG